MNDLTPLHFSVALAVLVFTWHRVWKTLALDIVRQNLFSIRDQLFDLAAEGKHGLGFDSPVYGAFREQLNHRIRYAHRVSSFHIWITSFIALLFGSRFRDDLAGAASIAEVLIRDLDNHELRGALMGLQDRANRQLVYYVALTSPVLLSLCLVSGVVIVVRELWFAVLRRSLAPAGRLWQTVRESEIRSRPAQEIKAHATALVESPFAA